MRKQRKKQRKKQKKKAITPRGQKKPKNSEKLLFLALSPSKSESKYKDFKNIKFDFLHTDLIRTPTLVFSVILTNSYNLFSLFWPKHIWQTIANHTNQYALFQKACEEIICIDQKSARNIKLMPRKLKSS